jgi:hypothetical protein
MTGVLYSTWRIVCVSIRQSSPSYLHFHVPPADCIDALWKQISHHLVVVSPSIGKFVKTTLFRVYWSSNTMGWFHCRVAIANPSSTREPKIPDVWNGYGPHLGYEAPIPNRPSQSLHNGMNKRHTWAQAPKSTMGWDIACSRVRGHVLDRRRPSHKKWISSAFSCKNNNSRYHNADWYIDKGVRWLIGAQR